MTPGPATFSLSLRVFTTLFLTCTSSSLPPPSDQWSRFGTGGVDAKKGHDIEYYKDRFYHQIPRNLLSSSTCRSNNHIHPHDVSIK